MDTLMNADLPQREKIKTPFAIIRIGGTKEKPYYGIVYYDPAERCFYDGFGSYNLDFVKEWLEQEFEIVDDHNEWIPVVHGRWILHPNGDGTCDQCGRYQKAIWDFDNQQNFCGHCGADMRERESNDTV